MKTKPKHHQQFCQSKVRKDNSSLDSRYVAKLKAKAKAKPQPRRHQRQAVGAVTQVEADKGFAPEEVKAMAALEQMRRKPEKHLKRSWLRAEQLQLGGPAHSCSCGAS